MARVNSLIRRYTTLNPVTGNEAATILLKDMVIDKVNRMVTVRNLPVELTGKEFDLLLFLASNKGRVFTKKADLYAGMGGGIRFRRQQHYVLYQQIEKEDRTKSRAAVLHSDRTRCRVSFQ